MGDIVNKPIALLISISILLNKFLILLGARISFKSIYNLVDSYNQNTTLSFLEIDKALKEWGFDTFAIRMKPQALSKIKYPVLSHITENDTEEFIILTNYDEDLISYIQAGAKEKKENITSFLKKWQGIILMADSDYTISESNYERTKEEDKKLQQNYLNNKMRLVDDFFSLGECNELIETSQTLFRRSMVTGDGKNYLISPYRTSQSAFLSDLEKELKNRIKEKSILLLNGLPYNRFEDIQCVSYRMNQEFKAHFDSGKGTTRLYTILVYLNDNFQGGETYFPLLDLTIKPKTGRALVFHNLEKNNSINIYSYHAGLPIEHGNKFICNIWIR